MANPTKEQWCLISLPIPESWAHDIFFHKDPTSWFTSPEWGERNPWHDRFYPSPEPLDDGGGAALAAYRFGNCK